MIPESQTKFDQYLNPDQTFMGEPNLTDDELKETLTKVLGMTIFLRMW